ncbi:MAG: SCO family protein [Gammaproteobacteria bacterium]|nr:SCO family protein [Gammaproteobacteria bacterium]
MRRLILATITIGLIVGSSVAWLQSTRYQSVTARQANLATSDLQGVLLPMPRVLTDFALSDQNNAPFTKEQLLGRWTLLFFGYTYCPDICPTTLLTLKEAEHELISNRGIRPQIALISVDPLRDDPATLGRYVKHFGDTYLGIHGRDEQLQLLTRQVGAMYERDTPDADGNYQVAHSSSVFVINPEGGLHAVFSAPHRSRFIAEKMTAMVSHYGAR